MNNTISSITNNYIVNNNEHGYRLDIFLFKKNIGLSRTRLKKLILDKNLKLNHKFVTEPSKKVKEGDRIDFQIPSVKKLNIEPFNFKLNIIYEDKNLIVIDKPSGISMHPGAGNYNETIVNALLNYDSIKLSNIGGETRPGIVHRIDKDTSGLVVIAKNNITHEKLSKQFADHSITRVYQALIWGKLKPQNGSIKTLITRSTKNRQLMSVSFVKGKEAITNYNTLEIFENKRVPTLSLIECKLETGRTHQIRVHMAHKGNNILGDQKYKKKFKGLKNVDKEIFNEINNLKRQFLHARKLGFEHPIMQERFEFSSKLPNDLEKFLKKLRKSK